MKQFYVRFEAGQEDRISPVYGPYPFVQLTYEVLRVGPEGESLAIYDAAEDNWLPLPENPGIADVNDPSSDYVWYSDVVIYSE